MCCFSSFVVVDVLHLFCFCFAVVIFLFFVFTSLQITSLHFAQLQITSSTRKRAHLFSISDLYMIHIPFYRSMKKTNKKHSAACST